jgi:hypothetical protein
MHMCVVTEKENRIVKKLVEVVGGGAGGVGGESGVTNLVDLGWLVFE